MKKFLLALAALCFLYAPAAAQCNGSFAANQFCGTTTAGPPGQKPYSAIFNTLPLPNADIFVGNASNIAAGVAPTGTGDCTFTFTNLGVFGYTCTKTNGVAFAPSATTDTTNANNISSGLLALARGGLGGSQAAATANQIPVFPGASGAAVPTSAPTWFDNAYCNTVGWLIARTTGAWTCSQGIPVNVEWFGVSSAASAATNNTNLATAIAAVPAGSGLIFPNTGGSGYNVSTTFTLSNPIQIACAAPLNTPSTGNINSTTDVDLWHANANGITFKDCYFNGTGTPTSRQAIAIGTDGVAASCSISSSVSTTTLTCTTSVFNAGMVTAGTRVRVNGAGAGGAPLFAIITGFTSATQVTVSVAASTTVTNSSTLIANVYTEVKILNTQASNYNVGFHFINAARYHVTDSYALSSQSGAMGLMTEDQVAVDFGDSFVTSSTFVSQDNTAGYAMQMTSGGSVKFSNNKFLGGKYNAYINFSIATTGGPLFDGSNSFEQCGTSAIFITAAAPIKSAKYSGHVTCGSPNVQVDNASGSIQQDAVFSGFTISGGGGTAFDLGKCSNCVVSGNNIDNGAVNPAINVRSSAANTLVAGNNIIGASVTIANASTTTTIDDQIGMGFANLPTAAANGSRIFVSNGAPASSPCTGSSTGSTAFRQNGAWKCF